jgi:hypothetical protein
MVRIKRGELGPTVQQEADNEKNRLAQPTLCDCPRSRPPEARDAAAAASTQLPGLRVEASAAAADDKSSRDAAKTLTRDAPR